MRNRLRRAVTVAAMAVAATAATTTLGAGQANALTGWTPYTVIAQSQATVGSVTATAQIRRSPDLNTYYTKITCSNTNPAATDVRVSSGYTKITDLDRIAGIVPQGPWGGTAVGYSSWFTVVNHRLVVKGTCDYYYNGHYGQVQALWSNPPVWVGYWTG